MSQSENDGVFCTPEQFSRNTRSAMNSPCIPLVPETPEGSAPPSQSSASSYAKRQRVGCKPSVFDGTSNSSQKNDLTERIESIIVTLEGEEDSRTEEGRRARGDCESDVSQQTDFSFSNCSGRVLLSSHALTKFIKANIPSPIHDLDYAKNSPTYLKNLLEESLRVYGKKNEKDRDAIETEILTFEKTRDELENLCERLTNLEQRHDLVLGKYTTIIENLGVVCINFIVRSLTNIVKDFSEDQVKYQTQVRDFEKLRDKITELDKENSVALGEVSEMKLRASQECLRDKLIQALQIFKRIIWKNYCFSRLTGLGINPWIHYVEHAPSDVDYWKESPFLDCDLELVSQICDPAYASALSERLNSDHLFGMLDFYLKNRFYYTEQCKMIFENIAKAEGVFTDTFVKSMTSEVIEKDMKSAQNISDCIDAIIKQTTWTKYLCARYFFDLIISLPSDVDHSKLGKLRIARRNLSEYFGCVTVKTELLLKAKECLQTIHSMLSTEQDELCVDGFLNDTSPPRTINDPIFDLSTYPYALVPFMEDPHTREIRELLENLSKPKKPVFRARSYEVDEETTESRDVEDGDFEKEELPDSPPDDKAGTSSIVRRKYQVFRLVRIPPTLLPEI